MRISDWSSDVCSSDLHGMDQIAVGVGQDVALASLDLLSRVIAARPAAFRRLHTLAVDHSGAGRSLAAYSFPPDQQQGMIELEPQTVIAPQIKPAPHRREDRKRVVSGKSVSVR